VSKAKTGADAAGDGVAGLSFEQALAELETIVQQLERGQLDLEASITAYERGAALRRHCADKLREAQLRVEKLSLGAAGEPELEPFPADPSLDRA
jgi:exodeoxyribonuclease VII small subunit